MCEWRCGMECRRMWWNVIITYFIHIFHLLCVLEYAEVSGRMRQHLWSASSTLGVRARYVRRWLRNSFKFSGRWLTLAWGVSETENAGPQAQRRIRQTFGVGRYLKGRWIRWIRSDFTAITSEFFKLDSIRDSTEASNEIPNRISVFRVNIERNFAHLRFVYMHWKIELFSDHFRFAINLSLCSSVCAYVQCAFVQSSSFLFFPCTFRTVSCPWLRVPSNLICIQMKSVLLVSLPVSIRMWISVN